MLFSSEGKVASKYSREPIRATDEHVDNVLKWLTDRDLKILHLLLHEPFMTTSQIEMMVFSDLKTSSWRTKANARLGRLYKTGCVDRFFPRLELGVGLAEAHYYLDYTGARALAKSKGYLNKKQFKWRKRTYLPNQYQHYSKILDFKSLLHVLNRQIVVGEIIHWNTQKRYDYFFTANNKVQKAQLFPDAFCIYKYSGTGLKFFFIEFDNATEPMETIKNKLLNYRRFHASGEWRKEKWARGNIFPAILFIFHRQEQVDEMVSYSRRLNSSLNFLFTTYQELYVDKIKEYPPNAYGKTRKVVESRYVRILDSIWRSKDGLVSF